MARVTSEGFAERLQRSAEQAVAIKRGEQAAGETVRRKRTSPPVVAEDAPQLTAETRHRQTI
jgi:hypothetical protein